MAVEEHRYYRIKGGEAIRVLNELRELRQQHADRLNTFLEQHSPEQRQGWGLDNGDIQGVRADPDNPPPGWRQLKRERRGWLSPDRRTKHGKKLAREMHQINQLRQKAQSAGRFFTGNTHHVKGAGIPGRSTGVMMVPAWGTVPGSEDEFMVSCPKDAECEPIDGLEPMTASDYMRLLEESQFQERAGA